MISTFWLSLLCFAGYSAEGFGLGDQKGGRKPLRIQQNDETHLLTRRKAMLGLLGLVAFVDKASAAVTDETDAFANTGYDSSYRGLNTPDTQSFSGKQSAAAPSDEITIRIPKSEITKGLGLELGQVEFKTSIRVFVKSILPGSVAENLGIRKDFVVVGVNGENVERADAEGVAIMVSQATKKTPEDGSIELRFRDPSYFQKQLGNLSSGGGEVTTQIAPSGDVKSGGQIKPQEDQKLTVTQLISPKMCTRSAYTDDLLEISYLGTVVDTGMVFDGSAIRINGQAVPGRGNDVSLFFVLGKQPFGQFPPGWDVGLEGMCIGERRRLIIPPVLAYGSTGVPRRGIPPDATLQYDITLISINGLATP